jgi:hypothetical protein
MYDVQNPNDVRHPLHPLNRPESDDDGGDDGGWGCLLAVVVLGAALVAIIFLILVAIYATWLSVALWFDWWWVPTAIGLSFVFIPYLWWLVRNLPFLGGQLSHEGNTGYKLIRNAAYKLSKWRPRKPTLIGGIIGAVFSIISLVDYLMLSPSGKVERDAGYGDFFILFLVLTLFFALFGSGLGFLWRLLRRLWNRLFGTVKVGQMTESEPLTDLEPPIEPDESYHGTHTQYPSALGTARKILLVCSVMSLALMVLIGTQTNTVWSGTGYTRGSGDWVAPWSDGFIGSSDEENKE